MLIATKTIFSSGYLHIKSVRIFKDISENLEQEENVVSIFLPSLKSCTMNQTDKIKLKLFRKKVYKVVVVLLCKSI